MTIAKDRLIAAITPQVPVEIATYLITEYQEIKHQFFLRRFRPSELNGGRFGECVVRLMEYLETGTYTPFGSHIQNTNSILTRVSNNTGHSEAIRVFITTLTRVVMNVRNRRDVAHVGGQVSPNYSDSLLVSHCADWIMVELVRHFYGCSINEARQIVSSINEVKIPIIAEVDGFIRVQNVQLEASDKTLVILYYKQPSKLKDVDLAKWIRYANLSRYKSDILSKLDTEALIHYENGMCTILPKGMAYVDKNIPLDLLM